MEKGLVKTSVMLKVFALKDNVTVTKEEVVIIAV